MLLWIRTPNPDCWFCQRPSFSEAKTSPFAVWENCREGGRPWINASVCDHCLGEASSATWQGLSWARQTSSQHESTSQGQEACCWKARNTKDFKFIVLWGVKRSRPFGRSNGEAPAAAELMRRACPRRAAGGRGIVSEPKPRRSRSNPAGRHRILAKVETNTGHSRRISLRTSHFCRRWNSTFHLRSYRTHASCSRFPLSYPLFSLRFLVLYSFLCRFPLSPPRPSSALLFPLLPYDELATFRPGIFVSLLCPSLFTHFGLRGWFVNSYLRPSELHIERGKVGTDDKIPVCLSRTPTEELELVSNIEHLRMYLLLKPNSWNLALVNLVMNSFYPHVIVYEQIRSKRAYIPPLIGTQAINSNQYLD